MTKTLLPFALSLFLVSCATKKMAVDHTAAPGTSLSHYGRYHLVVTPPSQADAIDWMIEKRIHDDLRAKGYTPVDVGSADVIVRYDVDVDEEVAERDSSTNAAPPPEGEALKSVSVTIESADRRKAIWHGTSVGEVAPSHLTASLEEAIERILDGVPRSAHARAGMRR